MDEQPITCRFVYTEQEYRRGRRAAQKAISSLRTRFAVIFFWLIVAVIVICGFIVPGQPPRLIDYHSPRFWHDAAVNFVPVLIFFVVLGFLFLVRRKSSFAKSTSCNEDFTYTLDEAGIAFDCPMSSGVLKWPSFSKAVENEDGFALISTGNRTHTWLPKSGFEAAEAIPLAREMIRAKVGDSRLLNQVQAGD